ncbi:MAG: hypothetical protein WA918_01345, partial [Erythrobacter sp.]
PTLRTPHRKSMKSIAIVLNQTLRLASASWGWEAHELLARVGGSENMRCLTVGVATPIWIASRPAGPKKPASADRIERFGISS